MSRVAKPCGPHHFANRSGTVSISKTATAGARSTRCSSRMKGFAAATTCGVSQQLHGEAPPLACVEARPDRDEDEPRVNTDADAGSVAHSPSPHGNVA